MAKKNFSNRLHDAVENYYHYNPDTLMPLMMVTLAAKGELQISSKPSKGSTVFCTLNPQQIISYDWVLLDPPLCKRIKQEIADNHQAICAVGTIDGLLKDIYETFYLYDTKTVVQEYHHRIGRLVHHSSNEVYEEAHRQYATLCLAEALIDLPPRWLNDCFLSIANHILVKSGLQPERPRLQVARTLCALLEYDGKGTIYNPFAGCAIAAAMLQAGNHLYVDGDINDKLFATARLLIYGKGSPTSHVVQRDSTKWIKRRKIKYALSTYRGYIDSKSAFDFCLSHCFDTLTSDGCYAGIISPKDIFENQSEDMKEALKRDWVDKIVLLPFGEVAILINAKKKKEYQGVVRFFNLTHPMLRRKPVEFVVQHDDYADFFAVSDIARQGFLRDFITPDIPQREGYEIIKLGDIVKKIKRQTYSLTQVPEDEQVMAFINRKEKYDMYNKLWMNNIEKHPISSLFAPAYHLVHDSLITNSKGYLEPRLFDADNGSVFFEDGYAFELNGSVNTKWLITELNEPYVHNQIHPYGMDEMVPEPVTENQILNLHLYREIKNEEQEEAESCDYLETGTIIHGIKSEYTIHSFLGNGNFGFVYSAESHNLVSGETKEIVLKEFYPHDGYHRENGKVVPDNDFTEMEYEDEKIKFQKEAELMKLLGNIPDSHIVPAYDYFECEETNTLYYVMPFYKGKSFEDLLNNGDRLTETIAISHAVIPLCKALNVSQKHKVLHLDIKPDNILIDDDGDAILTDFGTAKVYDDAGEIIDPRGKNYRGPFAALELREGSLTCYDPRPDMFGIAATIFHVITREMPTTIMELDKIAEENVRRSLLDENCSDQFVNAIVRGLQGSMSLRPKDAQAFLNLFPGCENIKLE